MPRIHAVVCRTDTRRSCPKEARWRPAAPATGPRRRVRAPRHGLNRPAAPSSNMRGLPRSESWPAFAGLDRRRQPMEALISSLPGSVTHQLAVEVYLRHCDAGAGACAGCGGRVPCPARRHAAPVIEAAGAGGRGVSARSAGGWAGRGWRCRGLRRWRAGPPGGRAVHRVRAVTVMRVAVGHLRKGSPVVRGIWSVPTGERADASRAGRSQLPPVQARDASPTARRTAWAT